MEILKDKYLSIETVMEVLSCKERHIYNLIRDGKLDGIKIGGRAVRISLSSLNNFIESNRIDPDNFFDPDLQEKTVKQPRVARSKWMDKE